MWNDYFGDIEELIVSPKVIEHIVVEELVCKLLVIVHQFVVVDVHYGCSLLDILRGQNEVVLLLLLLLSLVLQFSSFSLVGYGQQNISCKISL